MPERTSYAHGTPSWVDIASPDLDASAEFYGALFGWTATEAGRVEETGGYRMFLLGGKAVAGAGPIQNEGQPPTWTTYVAVDDADDVAEKVREAGGEVLLPPMPVMDAGRVGIFMDPGGAVFGIWEAGQTSGAQLVNEPGTLGWNELFTRDPNGATAFYAAVFGWEPAPWGEAAGSYTVWNVDGAGVGGMRPMDDNFPAEMPSHWGTCFVVADADAAVATAREHGGSITLKPFDMEGLGRVAGIADPHGATFAIVAPDAPPST